VFLLWLVLSELRETTPFLRSVINSLVDVGVYLSFIICSYFFVYYFMVNTFFYFSVFRLLFYVFLSYFQCGLAFCLSNSTFCCLSVSLYS